MTPEDQAWARLERQLKRSFTSEGWARLERAVDKVFPDKRAQSVNLPKCRACGNKHYGTCVEYFAANPVTDAEVNAMGLPSSAQMRAAFARGAIPDVSHLEPLFPKLPAVAHKSTTVAHTPNDVAHIEESVAHSVAHTPESVAHISEEARNREAFDSLTDAEKTAMGLSGVAHSQSERSKVYRERHGESIKQKNRERMRTKRAKDIS